jgi:fucose permease
MGVAALFLYVGIETLPMVSIIGYAKSVFGDVAGLESFSKYVTIGLVIGYIFGVLMIPKIISQTTALKAFAIIGIVASGLLIYLPGEYGVYCMAFLGFANSLMWPAIWPLAIADLGKFTKTGSSLLVMGIVGGAVVPFIFGMLVDAFKVNEVVTAASYQSAFWIFIPAYLFILYFGVKGHKLR